jgi:hypothetical protein
MEDELKPSKKKRSKKELGGEAVSFEALAKFTSSDVIRQIKMGMSKIAPLETEPEEPQSPEDTAL